MDNTTKQNADVQPKVSSKITPIIKPFLLEFISKVQQDKININNDLVEQIVCCFKAGCTWEDEKIELLLLVKESFVRYTSTLSILHATTITFQEFYSRHLSIILQQHFNAAQQTLTIESEIFEAKINGLKLYLDMCFKSFGQEYLYMQVQEQYTMLDTSTGKLQLLDEKQAELDRKQIELNEQQAKLKLQQTEIETKQKAIDEAISRANESITQQSQKVAESSITILGIFVGIVMVFFGDFSILSSAAVGIFEVPIHRLMLVFVSFGAILFNVIILLFYLVSKITQKSIGSVCMYSTACDRTVCQSCKHKPKFATLCKLRNTQPYVYYGNAVILLLFVFALSMYGLSGLQIELLTQKIQPFDLAIHIYDTRSQKDITVLQLILSGVITACVAICMFKVGKPHKTIQTTKT